MIDSENSARRGAARVHQAIRHSSFASYARSFYLAACALLVVAMLPLAVLPMQGVKLSLFALCALVAFLLWLREGLSADRATPRFRSGMWVFLLPVVYLLSYIFSTDRSVAFAGFSLEADTLLVVFLATAAFFLSMMFVSSMRNVRSVLTALSWTIGAAAVFQGLVLVTGGLILPDAFNDRSVNLIGKWNDFGLLMGLLLMFVLVRSDGSRRSYVVAGLLGLLLIIVNFPAAWYLLAAAGALWWLVRRVGGVSVGGLSKHLPLILIAASLVCVFVGPMINAAITRVIPVSSLEVRPSLSSTLDTATASQNGPLRTAFGTGPNTFGENWLVHKPLEVNNSLFWNLDFLVGFSTLATAFATVGAFGVLAWILPLVLIALAAWRLRRGASADVSSAQWSDLAALSLGAAYLFLSLVLYVPSQSIIILAFVLAGAALASLQSLIPARPARIELPRVVFLSVNALAAILLLFVTASVTRVTAAQVQTNRGASAFTTGNVDKAIELARSSRGIMMNGNALRLELDAGILKVRQLLETGDRTRIEENLAITMQPAVVAGQAAIVQNPRDYRPLISLAGLYGMLASVGVQQAYENSRDILEGAAMRNPTSPSIPLARARLEAMRGNTDGVAEYLVKALTLKSNYTDAILLDVQLKVAGEDIQGAIESAQAAALTAPNAPAVWFQLGLLHYAAKEYTDSVLAFEQAVELLPSYANAKYFLGLSYYEQERESDALRIFEALAQTNPDNAEVKVILGNLRLNQAPFAGVAAPSTEIPETAPIAE